MNVRCKVVLPMAMLAIATPLAAQDAYPARDDATAEPSVIQGKRQAPLNLRPLDRVQNRIDSRIQNRIPSRAGSTTAPALKEDRLSDAPR